MGRTAAAAYTPDRGAVGVYDQLYAEYVLLHDYLGRGANEVMHRLRALRDRVISQSGPAGDGVRP
jgi:L-ribulokinase